MLMFTLYTKLVDFHTTLCNFSSASPKFTELSPTNLPRSSYFGNEGCMLP